MKIVYWHEASGEVENIKKVSGLRAWKVYARNNADHLGELCLVRNGRTLRCACRDRLGVINGEPIFVYREWKV